MMISIASTTLFILTLKLIFIFGSTSLQTSSVIIKTTNLRQRQLPSESPPLRNLQADRAEETLSEVGTLCV